MMMVGSEYQQLLLTYYEEEIEGEGYFEALAGGASDSKVREKLCLLAKVERRAADLVLPLLNKYGLEPRDDSALHALGRSEAEAHLHLSWDELIDGIVMRYPTYIYEFEALESMAPAADLPALRSLTRHEVVTIEFAENERSGAPDSTTLLRKYLESTACQ